MEERLILLSGIPFDVDNVEYDDGLVIYQSTPTEEKQKNVVRIYNKLKAGEEVIISIGNYQKKQK
ncbi:MAG: hypothetical protein QME46_00890 [Thermoanaerobacteraceae bacterium]|nr:hypothetical protein [Thermoanaerobacteraceae bacterium]